MVLEMIVGEALQLGDLKLARVLAGEGGLYRKIKAAEVMEVPDINEWLTEGILIISTFYSVKDNPEAQISMFRKLIEVNGAGLVVKIGRYVHTLPETMLRLADEHNMPIIAIPVEVSFVGLLTILFETKFKEAQSVEAQLLEAVYKLGEARGLHHFLEGLGELTGENVLLESEEKQLIAYANNRVTAERQSFIFFSQPAKQTRFDKRQVRLVFKKAEAGLRCSVVIGVPHEKEHVWTSVLKKAATFLEEQIRFLLRKRLYQVNKRADEEKAWMTELIDKNAVPDHSSIRMLIDKTSYFGFLAMRRVAGAPVEKEPISALFLHQLYKKLDRYFPNAALFCKDGNVCILYTFTRDQGRAETISSIGRMLKELEEEMDVLFQVGVSLAYDAIALAKQAYLEARTALEESGETQKICLYEQMGFERIMTKLKNDDDVQAFAENTLKPLESADRYAGEALLHTLEVFLRENGNHSKTAEKLFVHRRTLKYRLEKIEERLMVDLNDSEVRFLLYFVLKMRK
ncbi:conserved hypothetical protein [Shouchella clausii KSM-K16]|uniref:PucR family transcriptional regulator n=2 Tax=Shouchella clausii TaxID=79880 RepID=Q5WKI7_SHOC1|nr:conserved hypothetical protein [Shouchella clausii KSM-K16]